MYLKDSNAASHCNSLILFALSRTRLKSTLPIQEEWKEYSRTFKTKESRAGLVWVPLFWKLHLSIINSVPCVWIVQRIAILHDPVTWPRINYAGRDISYTVGLSKQRKVGLD